MIRQSVSDLANQSRVFQYSERKIQSVVGRKTGFPLQLIALHTIVRTRAGAAAGARFPRSTGSRDCLPQEPALLARACPGKAGPDFSKRSRSIKNLEREADSTQYH